MLSDFRYRVLFASILVLHCKYELHNITVHSINIALFLLLMRFLCGISNNIESELNTLGVIMTNEADSTSNAASKAVTDSYNAEETRIDTVMKRLPVKTATIQKMRKISSLFADETGGDLKEPELIAFFLELSFNNFLKSGEIEKRIKALTGDL